MSHDTHSATHTHIYPGTITTTACATYLLYIALLEQLVQPTQLAYSATGPCVLLSPLPRGLYTSTGATTPAAMAWEGAAPMPGGSAGFAHCVPERSERRGPERVPGTIRTDLVF